MSLRRLQIQTKEKIRFGFESFWKGNLTFANAVLVVVVDVVVGVVVSAAVDEAVVLLKLNSSVFSSCPKEAKQLLNGCWIIYL